jgi:hypothetical protein
MAFFSEPSDKRLGNQPQLQKRNQLAGPLSRRTVAGHPCKEKRRTTELSLWSFAPPGKRPGIAASVLGYCLAFNLLRTDPLRFSLTA